MMSEGMSPADVVALSGNDGWGSNGSWFIWIILIFAIFGNGFWGNGNQQYATQQQVQSGFEAQNTFNTLQAIESNQAANAKENAILIKDVQYADLQNTNTLTNTINQGFNGISSQLCCGFNGVDKSIMQSTYDTTAAMNAGFNSVNQNLCNLSHQISDGVCAIKTQLLQDKYDQLLNEHNISTMANANAVQTQNILGALGNWYAKPPYAPLYTYGTAYGTTTAF